jgi:hypothetical protein
VRRRHIAARVVNRCSEDVGELFLQHPAQADQVVADERPRDTPVLDRQVDHPVDHPPDTVEAVKRFQHRGALERRRPGVGIGPVIGFHSDLAGMLGRHDDRR